MRTRWITLTLAVVLLFAPLASADGDEPSQGNGNGDEHPHGGPPGQGGNGNGSSGGDDDGSADGSEDTGAPVSDLQPDHLNLVDRSCRVVEWDGGDPEVGTDPLLGLIVIDVMRCLETTRNTAEGADPTLG